MRLGIVIVALCCTGLLTACGGGGSPENGDTGNGPPTVPATSQMAARAHDNPDGIDPLPSFRAASLPSSSRFAYRLEAPAGSPGITITPYGPHRYVSGSDLVPMMRRAAELWTRRIAGFRMPDGHYHMELSEDALLEMDFPVGYQQAPCPREACANHYGDPTLLPSDRDNSGRNPVIALNPSFLNAFVRNGRLTIGGFRILAHEFGHIVDFADQQNTGMYHADCGGGAIMCDRWESNVPAIPVERDFDGIRHHYDLRADTDHKQFGIWADAPGPDSDLEHFGVQVTRTLRVSPAYSVWTPLASNFISDRVEIEAAVAGTRSQGPAAGMGTASWSGDLIAVETSLFQPVLGAADLSMDLADVDTLDASFTELQRTDETGTTHALSDLAYTLGRTDDTWADSNGAVLASFYAVGADPGGAVAGTLDDRAQSLTGAFGALRER